MLYIYYISSYLLSFCIILFYYIADSRVGEEGEMVFKTSPNSQIWELCSLLRTRPCGLISFWPLWIVIPGRLDSGCSHQNSCLKVPQLIHSSYSNILFI